MRKLMLTAVLAATALPGAVNAQSHNGDDRRDRQDVRQDRRDHRDDRRDNRQDRRTAYVAPYGGWTYAPINNGYQLRPGFYGQRYWINDYGRYGLTAPRANLRWVRYGNDLVLVNVRTGRVLEVRHDRYW